MLWDVGENIGPCNQSLNPIQARLLLRFKGPRGVLKDPLMISGTIRISSMTLCKVIVLLKAYQNTKRNFQRYDQKYDLSLLKTMAKFGPQRNQTNYISIER